MLELLRRPKWAVVTVLVIALVALTFNLGLWQLRRLDERQARNDLVAARVDAAPIPVGVALGSGEPDLRYLPVSAVGRFLPDQAVLVANRSFEGAPGFWVLAPFVTADETIVVNRGFVNRAELAGGLDAVSWPTGEVAIDGLLQTTVEGGVFATEEDPPVINRPDVAAIADRMGFAPTTAYLQAGAADAPLNVVPPPPLDDGPHLAYAGQWFIFGLIALGGYPLVLRRVAGA